MSEIVDRIVAILVGPGASCFMTKSDAESDAREILRAIREHGREEPSRLCAMIDEALRE